VEALFSRATGRVRVDDQAAAGLKLRTRTPVIELAGGGYHKPVYNGSHFTFPELHSRY
jgi:hypothetical protein